MSILNRSAKHLATLDLNVVRKELNAQIDSPKLFDYYTKVVSVFPKARFTTVERALQLDYKQLSTRLSALIPQLVRYCTERGYVREQKLYSKASTSFMLFPVYDHDFIYATYHYMPRKKVYSYTGSLDATTSKIQPPTTIEPSDFDARQYPNIMVLGIKDGKSNFVGIRLYVEADNDWGWSEYGCDCYAEKSGVVEADGKYNGSLLVNLSALQKLGVAIKTYRHCTANKQGIDEALDVLKTKAPFVRLAISDLRIRAMFHKKGYSADALI